MKNFSVTIILSSAALSASLLSGCDKPPEPTADQPGQSAQQTATPPPPPSPPAKRWSPPPASDADPTGGKFTLDDALKDLPGSGDIIATIDTDAGSLSCKLFQDKAPNTVANFVGLARGVRPAWDGSAWVKKPAYDGTLFHRIIKGFMIQGGSMNGAEETGYTIKDEIWPGAAHDHAGQLCMANRGKDTNSKQFFITDAAAAHLDAGGYTIFGECTPVDTIHTLASKGDKASKPPVIKTITISRGAPGGADSATASTSASAAPSASAGAAPSAKPSASVAPAAGSSKPKM